MQHLKHSSLQWAVGGFCSIVGAFILVAPHQFSFLPYIGLKQYLWLFGSALLAGGLLLLLAWASDQPRWLRIIAHFWAGAFLIILALDIIDSRALLGSVNLIVLGAGTILAGLWQPSNPQPQANGAVTHVYLPALIGFAGVASGLVTLFAPESLAFYSMSASVLRLFGLLFIGSGLWLNLVQFIDLKGGGSSRAGRFLAPVPYLLTAALYMIFASLAFRSAQLWVEILFYLFFAAVLVVLPWAGKRLRNLRRNSARTRLALILGVAAAFPLILTVAVVSEVNEQAAKEETRNQLQRQSLALARNALDYVQLQRSALDAFRYRLAVTPVDQENIQALLDDFVHAYIESRFLAIYDQGGQLQFHAENGDPPPARLDPNYFTSALGSDRPLLKVVRLPGEDEKLVLMAARVTRSDTEMLAVMATEANHLIGFLDEQSLIGPGNVFLVDNEGSLVAYPGRMVTPGDDLSTDPVVSSWLTGDSDLGTRDYFFNGKEYLSGYAIVPGLDWAVIIERPADLVLAGVYTGRELAFLILLAFLIIMVAAGSVVAGWLTAPLAQLAQAANQFAAGNPQAPLPTSSMDEVAQLTRSFRQMRFRLTQRTLERDQAESALQKAHDELEIRVQQRTAELEETTKRLSVALEEYDEVNERLQDINKQLAQANESLKREVLQRKRTERALANYTRQLERSNRELQDFAYIASHDLQEPLRKVQAFGARILERYGDQLDDRGRDYIERMHSAAARMQKMINDLLAFSRVTTKARPFELVDLNEVARQVRSDLEPRILETGGKVEIGELPSIYADGIQMYQLLQNLVANGLKFHKKGEAPLVRVYNMESQAEGEFGSGGPDEQQSEIQIAVSDNGIGFDEKYLDRIFQPFQRLHGRTAYPGSGIGLAVCRKIVNRHGGDLTARSTPGGGATFIIRLPVHPEDQAVNYEQESNHSIMGA